MKEGVTGTPQAHSAVAEPAPPSGGTEVRVRSSSSAALVPLAVIVPVCVIDLAGGPDFVIIALVAVAPLLAASLVGPQLTGAYALAAFTGALVVALHDQLEAPEAGGGPTARVIRLAGIAIAGGVAVVTSRVREARERRLTALVRVADAAQRAILSPLPPTIGGLRFVATYQSAAAEATIGGDLYEVADSRWGVRIIVGDVRGKGLDAIRLASRVLGAFRTLAVQFDNPADLVEALDREVARLGDEGGEDFVTAIVAQVDPAGRMLLLNAGHLDPLLVHDRAVEVLGVSDRQPPLGLGAAPTAAHFLVSRSDRLLFYTDGLAEARNPRTQEFFPLLPAVKAAFSGGELPDAVADLASRLGDWTGGPLGDDVALVAVEHSGRGPLRSAEYGGAARLAP